MQDLFFAFPGILCKNRCRAGVFRARHAHGSRRTGIFRRKANSALCAFARTRRHGRPPRAGPAAARRFSSFPLPLMNAPGSSGRMSDRGSWPGNGRQPGRWLLPIISLPPRRLRTCPMPTVPIGSISPRRFRWTTFPGSAGLRSAMPENCPFLSNARPVLCRVMSDLYARRMCLTRTHEDLLTICTGTREGP